MQNPVTTVADKIQQRPAESSTIAGFVALLIARLLGLTDPDTILAIAGVIAFVPTAVTWAVENLAIAEGEAMSSSDYIEINEGEDGRFSLYHLDENQEDLGRPLASGLSLREAILQAQGRDTEYGIHVTFRGRPLEGARPHWSIRVGVGGMSWKVEA